MAREFQRSLEDMAREAELDDVKREIEKVGRTDIKRSIEKTIDPTGELRGAFDTRTTLETGDKTTKPAVAANGEAKEPALGKSEMASEPPVKAAAAEPVPRPESASRPTTPAQPKSEAKPKAAAKPKTEAKPKSEAKPRGAAKSRTGARSKAAAGAAPKAASQENGKAETAAEPH
jgi:sec-independent protein translocase protein TatB